VLRITPRFRADYPPLDVAVAMRVWLTARSERREGRTRGEDRGCARRGSRVADACDRRGVGNPRHGAPPRARRRTAARAANGVVVRARVALTAGQNAGAMLELLGRLIGEFQVLLVAGHSDVPSDRLIAAPEPRPDIGRVFFGRVLPDEMTTFEKNVLAVR